MSAQYSNTLRGALLGATAIVAIAGAEPVAAQTIQVSIAAQDLGPALQSFALKNNLEILYAPELVSNLRTQGARGAYSPEEAMRQLLRGTGLTFSQPSANVFVLRRASAPAGASRVSLTQEGPATVSQSRAATSETARASLNGTITSAETGAPIPGAIVTVVGTDITATTDDSGNFRFLAIPVGEQELAIDYVGSPTQVERVLVEQGTTSRVQLTFAKSNKIVVVGFVNALQRALNQQRSAANNSTVVSADEFGNFPAETVSEGLRRVPGVAFGRAEDTGEGSRITIRGFSSEAINVQVNGVDLQGTNFERTIDLSGYLAENISEVTIHKSLLPSHEATGSGGLVEIETKSGLDYGAFHLSGGIEHEFTPESGFGGEWQANGVIGGQLTSNFGVAATIAYRDTDRTNYDIFDNSGGTTPPVWPDGYSSNTFVPADIQFPFDPEFDERLHSALTYITRDREETNLAASFNAAWDIADHTRLRLDLQHNERDATTFFSRSAVQYLTALITTPVPELGDEVRRRRVLSSLRPGLSLQESDSNLISQSVSFRGDTNIERWTFRYKGAYLHARAKSSNNSMTLLGDTFTNLTDLIDPTTIETAPDAAGNPRIIDGGFVLAPNGVPVPALTQQGFDLLGDPSIYRVSSAARSITNSPTNAWIFEGSARFSPESFLDYVEVGGKYDRSKRSALDDAFAANVASLQSINSYNAIAGRNTYVSDIGGDLLLMTGLSRIGLGAFAVPSVSQAGNAQIFSALDDLLEDDPTTPLNEQRFTFTDISDADPILDATAQRPAGSLEERLAGYVETHLVLGDFDLIGGARIERTKRSGTAISIPAVTLNTPTFQREPRETFVAAGLVDFVDLETSDTTITPSFLLNYRPIDEIVARLGYFRSTVNPSIQMLRRQTQYFIDLRPAFNQVTVREGNPDLEPSKTDNWDFDVAYYFRDSPGLVRFGAFYKKISNNFTNVFVQDVPDSAVRQRVLDYFAPLAESRPDLIAFNDETEFLFSRPENGEGGTIWGLEAELTRQFTFLPGFLSGFGFTGNVTYTNGDFPTLVSGRDEDGDPINVSLDRPLADEARWVYNAGLTYSRGGLEGLLIYTHQSATVEAYEIHDLNTVIPSYSTLDMRVSYTFDGPLGGTYTAYIEGNDLLSDADEPDIRRATASTFGRGDASFFFPDLYQFSGGRTVSLGLKARF